jgi:hypothetical protein
MQDDSSGFSTAFSSRIPPPSDDRPPLRVNGFEYAQIANTSLAPMFPYLQRGAIVPTTSLMVGGPNANYGHFFHENTEEEVALVIADHGGIKNTGMMMIAPQLHGVQSFLKDPLDPESFLLIVITQRQSDDRRQQERVFFRCGCNEVLFEQTYDSTPDDVYDPHANHAFLTNKKSGDIAIAFNGDEALRTCKRCGKISPPFPHAAWGWDAYATSHDVAALGRRSLLATGVTR